MAPQVPAILLGLLMAGMVAVIVSVSATSGVDPVPPPLHMGFEVGHPENHFQQRVCPCKNDWPLATNEREISNARFKQVGDIPDARGFSALVAFWGQFMDHDVVLSTSDPAQGFFSVQMTPYDAILNMTRNKVRLNSQGCRESETRNTPIIDASTVYGDYFKHDLIHELRDGASCRLKTSAGKMLPLQHGGREFLAGDERATEHAILASLHTIWMREHNRLCLEMPASWTEEQKFWKARQVVIGKIQHITYEEWLPAVFGTQYHLLSTQPAKGSGTRLTMEFATVAFRYGHTQIPDPIGPFALPTIFFNAPLVIQMGIEPFLSAAFQTRAQKVDSKVIDGLREFLFAAGPHVIGEDLMTRNLFRHRELGMGTYQQIKDCFASPSPYTPLGLDSFPELLSEPLVPDSSLPPTLARIIAEQFRRLRDNDPNYYLKIAGQIGSKYYNEIRQTTLASVIRLNTDLTSVPDKVFFV